MPRYPRTTRTPAKEQAKKPQFRCRDCAESYDWHSKAIDGHLILCRCKQDHKTEHGRWCSSSMTYNVNISNQERMSKTNLCDNCKYWVRALDNLYCCVCAKCHPGMMGFGVVAITPRSNGKKAENNTIFHSRMGRKALQDNGRVCSSSAKPV